MRKLIKNNVEVSALFYILDAADKYLFNTFPKTWQHERRDPGSRRRSQHCRRQDILVQGVPSSNVCKRLGDGAQWGAGLIVSNAFLMFRLRMEELSRQLKKRWVEAA